MYNSKRFSIKFSNISGKNSLFYFTLIVSILSLAFCNHALAQSPIRADFIVNYGGQQYAGSGQVSSGANGSVNFTLPGKDPLNLPSGANEWFGGAVNLSNNNGNVSVSVDTAGGEAMLGGFETNPSNPGVHISVGFEGNLEFALPYDYYFSEAALKVDRSWRDRSGGQWHGSDIYGLGLEINILGLAGHGTAMTVGQIGDEEFPGLIDIPSERGCEELLRLEGKFTKANLPHIAQYFRDLWNSNCKKKNNLNKEIEIVW